jgi:8-oxo-dGTP pyrophosphatase MutT (NUDIX family)
MTDAARPVDPKPAASVIIVRDAPSGAPEPIEVYMIRRKKAMKFLGGFYAFPGGKVDPDDASATAFAYCHGLDVDEAARCFPNHDTPAPLAFWVAAVRELLEESGVLLACDGNGRAIDPTAPQFFERLHGARRALVGGQEAFPAILAREGWRCDLRPLRYVSHFVTPRSSPIRFTARFFLCRLPAGQEPRLFTEETSEGFWIHPGDGYRRFLGGEMAMAEPAEFGLAFIAQFASVGELWDWCGDNREKFTGVIDRIEFWQDFDWKRSQGPQPGRKDTTSGASM